MKILFVEGYDVGRCERFVYSGTVHKVVSERIYRWSNLSEIVQEKPVVGNENPVEQFQNVEIRGKPK